MGAGILMLGLFATAVVGAPLQVVLPETIKSIVAALFVLLALAAFIWRLGQPDSVIRWSKFLIVPFGLAVAAVASTAWSPFTSAVTEAIRWFVMGTIIWVGMNVLHTSSFVWVSRSVHWAALLVSLIALMQFWFDFSWFPAGAAPGATFGNRNMFAEFIAAAMPFSLWLLFRETRLNRVIPTAFGVGIILVALMCTGSRAALIAVGIGITLTLLFLVVYRIRSAAPAPAWGANLAAVALPLAMMFTLGGIPTANPNILSEHSAERRGLTPIERTSSRIGSLFNDQTYTPDSSFGIRRAAWAAGGKMIAAHPILGVGAGGWNATAPLFMPETIDTEHVWMAHNEALQLVAEYGLAGWAGLLALACLLAAALAEIARSLLRKENTEAAFQKWAAVLSIGLFGIASLGGLNLHMATTCYLLALSIGYLLATRPHGWLALPAGAPRGYLTAGRFATGALVVVAGVVSFQGVRSDVYIQRGTGVITALERDKSIPKATAAQLRAEAVNDVRRGLDIYSDQGYVTIALANSLAVQEDPASVLWLSNLMLATRPHVVGLKCNLARAHSDLGDFPAAGKVLEGIKASRPKAACLPLSEFVYAYKGGRFDEALAVGQKMIQDFTTTTPPEVARYVVDTTYRAAIRVPAVDAAIGILRVRAQRWPELEASSWLLIGQLTASRTPGQVSGEAVDAFKRSLATASAQEKAAVSAMIPEIYRARLN